MTIDLIKLGLFVYPSKANFLLVRIGKEANKISQLLKDKKIIIRDRSSKKYLKGCFRITVRSPIENKELIKTLKEII